MDSTTLTRTLAVLRQRGWVQVKPGKDRRERRFSLAPAGKRRMAKAQPFWERAEQRLRKRLGAAAWKAMQEMVARVTVAAVAA
jgi:DNA-binding MarR family transcriptional regulator